MTRHHSLWVAAAALAGGACAAGQAQFQPTENVSATSRGGQPAAGYEVEAPNGTVAHVNVWSEGAFRSDDGRTIAQVALEIRNTGEQPIRLDREMLELEAFREDAGRAIEPVLVSMRAEGPSPDQVPAARATTVHLYFALPGWIEPNDVEGMRLRWALRYDGRRYVQFTDFQRQPEPEYYASDTFYPLYGFYDPWLYGGYYFHRPFFVPVKRIYVAPKVPSQRAGRSGAVSRRR